jgi:hypothetical protein
LRIYPGSIARIAISFLKEAFSSSVAVPALVLDDLQIPSIRDAIFSEEFILEWVEDIPLICVSCRIGEME